MRHFDLIVIGTGPAGQKAAIQAAKLGKSVAIIEKREALGGVCLHTGTIPSKSLREAVVQLNRPRFTPAHGLHAFNTKVTMDDLIFWSNRVIRTEMEVIRSQMARNGVELIQGEASFDSANVITVSRPHSSEPLSADRFVIAVGTRPARVPTVAIDNVHVFDSDGLWHLPNLPKSMIIVGGGVIGTEYACIFAQIGIRILLVEGRESLLEFADHEVVESLQYHMRRSGITLRLGEHVRGVEILKPSSEPNGGVVVHAIMESGKTLKAESLMYCIGRVGATASLGLDRIGLATDERGRIRVNEFYQSPLEHIYAVGDVIGFPALASTSMEQGRLAACHMFGVPSSSMPHLFPYGIYAIPEISMVGRTEKQLTEAGIPYEVGLARYNEIARGQLVGDDIGMLKLLVHEKDRSILGVHCIGTGATELVHIGQAVMALNGTVDFFVNNVFNYPTLAEAYKVAALNASNKLAAL